MPRAVVTGGAGFIGSHMVDLCAAFRTGRIPDPLNDIRYYNVKTVQASGLA